MPRSRLADRPSGVALIMVLLVLSALAIIATPFAVSMALHDRASRRFQGEQRARLEAEAIRNHAVARLQAGIAPLESDQEAVELEAKRPPDPGRNAEYTPPPRLSGRPRTLGSDRPQGSGRRRLVRRADLGEEPETRRGRLGGNAGEWAKRAAGRAVSEISHEADQRFLASEKGPSPKNFDPPADLEVPPIAPRSMADPAAIAVAEEAPFPSPELAAQVRVEDEQGKINLNSAPPQLLGSLVGSSRLERSLEPGAVVLSLEEGAPFRAAPAGGALAGAVILIHPETSRVEAITYRSRRGNQLEGCFRGAFFSLPFEKAFPAGTPVYDLRGWKLGHHQLRAGAAGSFATDRLADFATVEAAREIASWQIASLFLIRFRGEGLTGEFLQKNGISTRKLEALGLDPEIFAGDDPTRDAGRKAEYDVAVKALRKLRVSSELIESLRKARGARGVISFEARLASLKPAETQKVCDEMRKSLERDRRQAPHFDREYLESVLANLSDAYRSPGLETFLPEEMEDLRTLVTVSSAVPARWSEPQTNPDRLPSGPAESESFRAARPGELGGGALVRIRDRRSPELAEFNRIAHRGGSNIPVNGYQLAYPLSRDYAPHGASIQALQRHPVNVNTASERVLRAVFTGVQGFKRKKRGDHTVSPAQAAGLAALVRSRLPLRGHEDFWRILVEAQGSEIIDDEDVEPLFLNAIQPNDPRLMASTTGLCYASGDVYTIESVGVQRTELGGALASVRMREIVEVSASEPLRLGLFAQGDFQSELILRDPHTPLAPEDHWSNAISFPGIRGHLVDSTPLLLQGGTIVSGSGRGKTGFVHWPIAGGEMGTLRLALSESGSNRSTHGDLYHFRETREGLELGPGENFVLDISVNSQNGGAAAGAAGGGVKTISNGAGSGVLDLTNLPASIDFWVRFRTYPEVVSRDGLIIILDAGAEEERDRIQLLYDRSRSEFVARIHDSSLPDPSIPQGKQYLEVRAKRPLDLETWYHLRLAWDGTYDGGLQLFIDGLPVGTASFATELAGALPASGASTVPVKDRSALPLTGSSWAVVRAGGELFELERGGTQIRRKKPSSYTPWRAAAVEALKLKDEQRKAKNAQLNNPVPPQLPSPQQTAAAQNPDRFLMRFPWNQRGGANGAHLPGEPVSLFGYSLEMVRKLRDEDGFERQASVPSTTGGSNLVWGAGGIALGDELLPWNSFPPGVVGIHHLAPLPLDSLLGALDGGAGGPPGSGGKAAAPPINSPCIQQYLVPVFCIDVKTGANLIPGGGGGKQRGNFLHEHVYSAEIQLAGRVYNAADFFQREGVTLAWLQGNVTYDRGAGVIHFDIVQTDLHFIKEPIGCDHPATKPSSDPRDIPLVVPQRIGLRVTEWYPITKRLKQFQAQVKDPKQLRENILGTYHAGAWLRPISLLSSGPARNLYPPSGILEVRGVPAAWSIPPRPDLSSASLFEQAPEDTVEWMRYVLIHPARTGGDLFIGRYTFHAPKVTSEWLFGDPPLNRDGYNTFRGYPETVDELKNQMAHRAGEPLRLVMELADGGAGFGDYVTIATKDPAVYEPIVRRVYNVSERNDGRFFVSLYTDEEAMGGQKVVPYQNRYTPEMNPRLVKFPSGALPQVGTGRMFLFGDSGAGRGSIAGGGTSSGGAPAAGATHALEEEGTSGTIVDEIRRSLNKGAQGTQVRGQRVKHVVVPLDNGRVRWENTGNGTAAITGLIPEGKSISRESPMEVLIVSTGREIATFAPGESRGVLRIGEELFFFENPEAGDGTGSVAAGTAPQGSGGHGNLDPTKRWVRPDDEQDAAEAAAGRLTPGGTTGGNTGGGANASQYQADTTGERRYDERLLVWSSPPVQSVQGKFEKEGFARIDDQSPQLNGFYEIFYYRTQAGNQFQDCLRGQFLTPIVARYQGTHPLRSVTQKLRLIGRGLLGSRRTAHGFADPVSLMPYLDFTEVSGPLTDTNLEVRDTKGFPALGYLLLDPALPGTPFEILAYKGIRNEASFLRPLDEDGKGIFRGCFGTVERPIHSGLFAYGMPFRHFDRYQENVESENLAYLQKSFRAPAARWRSLRWRERRPRGGRERLCEVVVAARIDGAPDWSEKPTNRKGGIYFFEAPERGAGVSPEFPIDATGDELEVRIYFRYRTGSFQRISEGIYRDDWKETPILEWIAVEYEKAGRILRHEEPAD